MTTRSGASAGSAPLSRSDDGLAASFDALSRLIMVDTELPATLIYVADFAVSAIPGADGAGLMLFQDDRPDTVVASADFVREADALQYSIGEGPCITATREGRSVRSGVLDRDPAFPMFGPQAATLGLHSALSLPLLTGNRVIGSISLYAYAENAFDDRAAELGELFAGPAAVTVQNAQSLSQSQRLAALQQAAMTSLDAGRMLALTGLASARDDTHVARKQTAYADASKREFLTRISHQLRTPLNAVLGFAELLELDPLTHFQRESVDHILRSGRESLAMIENILDITAIDSDHLEVTRRRVSVTGLLDDAISAAIPLATTNRIEIGYHPHPFDPLPYVTADPARVRQVLDNVLSNAIKFNHPGKHSAGEPREGVI